MRPLFSTLGGFLGEHLENSKVTPAATGSKPSGHRVMLLEAV
jgi:hypothetical protein